MGVETRIEKRSTGTGLYLRSSCATGLACVVVDIETKKQVGAGQVSPAIPGRLHLHRELSNAMSHGWIALFLDRDDPLRRVVAPIS